MRDLIISDDGEGHPRLSQSSADAIANALRVLTCPNCVVRVSHN